MSIKVIDEVLSRMILDKEFRDLLRHDPEHTLASYELIPEERAALYRLRKQATRHEKRQTIQGIIHQPESAI